MLDLEALLRKGDPSYRPISLLVNMGKLYERLIQHRLVEEIQRLGDLSDRQYGFRKQRDTIDAVKRIVERAGKARDGTWRTRKIAALVTFDIRNAFNTANWRLIAREAVKMGVDPTLVAVIQSYLSDRELVVAEEIYTGRRNMTNGVSQGSVLGPLLWNILNDGVLRLDMLDGVKLIGFADDISMLAVAKTEGSLRR